MASINGFNMNIKPGITDAHMKMIIGLGLARMLQLIAHQALNPASDKEELTRIARVLMNAQDSIDSRQE